MTNVFAHDHKVPPWAHLVFAIIYWLSLAAVLLILLLLLIRAFVSPTNFLFWLQYVALATLVVCIILLVGDLVGLVLVPRHVRTAIFSTFVVGVLSAAAAVVKQSFNDSPSIMVATSTLLDETQLSNENGIWCPTKVAQRQNSYFKVSPENELGFFVATVVRNFGLDLQGGPMLGGYAILITQGGISDVGQLPYTQAVDAWKRRPMAKCPGITPDQIAADLQMKPSDALFLEYLQANPLVVKEVNTSKAATLHILISDDLRHLLVESQPFPLTIQ